MSHGLRELIADNKQSALTAGGLLILVAAVAFGYQLFQAKREQTPVPTAYFTIDDGATYFKDAADRFTPFETDGVTGVRARLFRCQHGQFVGYLERASDDARRRATATLELARGTSQIDAARAEVAVTLASNAEVKPTGPGGAWISKYSPDAETLVNRTRCPHSPSDFAEAVDP